MTDTDLYNAREQLADVAKWLGWQDECLAFGLVNSYDALRLYDYAQAHPELPEMAEDWEPEHRVEALGYDPLDLPEALKGRHVTETGAANGPFKSEASMLDWMSLCLNCNTNNAAVVLEKISPPSMAGGGLWRINDAFESVNKLLDASGALDNAELQFAVYVLRLSIARAAGDTARCEAAEKSLQELSPAIAEFDLATFDGWVGAAKALLADKPPGTALDDSAFQGYLVLEQGTLYAIPKHAVEDNKVVTEWGVPVDAYEPDQSIWSDEHQAWEAHDPMTNRDVLLMPKFVKYEKSELTSS